MHAALGRRRDGRRRGRVPVPDVGAGRVGRRPRDDGRRRHADAPAARRAARADAGAARRRARARRADRRALGLGGRRSTAASATAARRTRATSRCRASTPGSLAARAARAACGSSSRTRRSRRSRRSTTRSRAAARDDRCARASGGRTARSPTRPSAAGRRAQAARAARARRRRRPATRSTAHRVACDEGSIGEQARGRRGDRRRPRPRRRELWRCLLDFDWTATITAARCRPTIRCSPCWRQPRRMKYRMADGLWVRLLDVGAALAARTYAEDGDIVFEVRDPLCPWNEGALVACAASGPTRPPTSRSTSRRSAPRTSAAGASRASPRAATSRSSCRGAIDRADGIFRHGLHPWCPEIFSELSRILTFAY